MLISHLRNHCQNLPTESDTKWDKVPTELWWVFQRYISRPYSKLAGLSLLQTSILWTKLDPGPFLWLDQRVENWHGFRVELGKLTPEATQIFPNVGSHTKGVKGPVWGGSLVCQHCSPGWLHRCHRHLTKPLWTVSKRPSTSLYGLQARMGPTQSDRQSHTSHAHTHRKSQFLAINICHIQNSRAELCFRNERGECKKMASLYLKFISPENTVPLLCTLSTLHCVIFIYEFQAPGRVYSR